MSTASNRSHRPNRSSVHSSRRPRASSRALLSEISTTEDGYSFALRVAFLNYLLQPKKKRKEYVAAPAPPPKPVQRVSTTSSVAELMKEFMPSGSSSSSSSSNLKLPHGFRSSLEKRIEGVMRGVEKLPGYNDAAVKRSFGEAYITFTADAFQRSIDKDRKIEPLILMFYTSASKAQGRGKAADDDNWKSLVDRHVALFVRLVSSLLRDHGSGQSRLELINRLTTLEKKLLTNDQDLYLDTGQAADGSGSGHGASAHRTVEVEVPLTYLVRDMPMVQTVAAIYGRSHADVQNDIDRDMSLWTEAAALRDLKTYQHRLTSNMPGALRRQDFDVDAAFEEWKKAEIHQLTQMMMEVLTGRPQLARISGAFSGAFGAAAAVAGGVPGGSFGGTPASPSSPTYTTSDEAYADLSRMLAQTDLDGPGGLGSSALGSFDMPALDNATSSSLGSADEVLDLPSYAFIPPDARACYRAVLRKALLHDRQHPDEALQVSPETPLLRPSMDLLIELAVHWRLPQSTRAVLLLDVAVQLYVDLSINAEALYNLFEDVRQKAGFDHLPHNKKPPHIQLFGQPLDEIARSRWPTADLAIYQHVLARAHDALLRELLELGVQCYDARPPPVMAPLLFLQTFVVSDEAFSPPDGEAEEQFALALTQTLHSRAADVYRDALDTHVPQSEAEWDFSHVVELGRAVVALCERTRKRYRKVGDLLGVSPFTELVATVFPSFEQDAKAMVELIMQMAHERGLEVNVQDGFDLYRELVDIRRMHAESLPPDQPFAFHIESLLEEFVWRWIRGAQERMESIAEEAVKHDDFQVRASDSLDGVGGDDAQDNRHSVSVLDLFAAFNQAVEQIVQLKWDDEVHHAKFMTALAKAFAGGIGRYCDIIDTLFSKEMDRPSAQELANANKTAQERWMQYAKDALSSKEKVEPFQFYAESFVKLNNIEYAMQALDKLEAAMEVDACAEVLLRANGPPKPMDRRNAKYIFTIKIVEAEDLKACDPNGTSDPYVVLGDEYGKRLAKTRIIMRNLNPRWDESVEVTVQGALNIVATIWDYDTFGDHDFVGRTSLKLDPLHFGDYLPREFWLDLDTQGRLMLRVSMEGERDDIQFHFGKAFRHLKRTERDMVRKITDKLVAHIQATLSLEALRSLLNRGSGLASSVAALWQKRTSLAAGASLGGGGSAASGGASGGGASAADVENALKPLFVYFNENFAIMNQTLTRATMLAVMARLWKEVLMAVEALLVPPLSEKPSTQRPLTQGELDTVYRWLELLFDFFNARDPETGEVLGVPADVLKSPKWHELASLNFFYFDTTENLVRTSERMAAATAQRVQQQQQQQQQQHQRQQSQQLLSRPTNLPVGFASMGTIRRGKSVMMSRSLGTMRQAKAEKRKEAQADPSDDMILRILRMRPEAAGYLKERHRQKERMAANQAAALIVRQSINQGFSGPAFGGATYSRNSMVGGRR